MSNTMTYKDYLAKIEYSDDDACFVGHIAGISDIIGFHGESVAEIKQAFQDSVNDYVSLCKKTGKQPQKTASGKIMLRVPPELHAQASCKAQAEGKSMNKWFTEILDHAVHS